tara:strand:- start:2414 stop:2686 length:273 start_codon:yes stop_codon:yes gene_type:complete
MKYIITFFLIGAVSLFPQELKQNSKKESKFLEIKVNNPELQIEVDGLKKEYELELSEIKAAFKERKKSLRKSYRLKLKELRKRYKKKKNK